MNRVIFHIDQNSFFATVEQQVNPGLRGKPIGVTQGPGYRTVVVAASIEAKAHGVKTGMFVYEARQRCPALIVIDGDLAKYHAVTEQCLNIYKDYSPYLEIFSIDEVFIDMTQPVRGSIAFACQIAKEIKQRIRHEVGEWLQCSIGIAANKTLAKLASGMHKPDGLVLILEESEQQTPNDIKRYTVDEAYGRVQLQDICGIGPRVERRLHAMGVSHLLDLRCLSHGALMLMFGRVRGTWLYWIARGRDVSPVIPYYQEHDPKSVGQRLTFPQDITDRGAIYALVQKLSYQIAYRLRTHSKRGRTIHLVMRSSNIPGSTFPFWGMAERMTIKTPTNDGRVLTKCCWQLFERLSWNGPVRMIGVSIDHLTSDATRTPSFLLEDQRTENIHTLLDTINDRFGPGTLRPARLLGHRSIPEVNGYGKASSLFSLIHTSSSRR